ncbi:MAG: hypothetical protein Q9194_001571 [Teloschistes cf. exilis]
MVFGSRLSVVLLLFGSSIHALPASSGIPSGSVRSSQGNIIATAPIPTATGPTCIQTRSPSDPSGSDIGAAVQEDDSINKACNINTQQTITTHNGLFTTIGDATPTGTATNVQTFNPPGGSASARGSSGHDETSTRPDSATKRPSFIENSGDHRPTSTGPASSGQALGTHNAPASTHDSFGTGAEHTTTGRAPTSNKLSASQGTGGQPPTTEPNTGSPSNTRASSQQSSVPLPPGATVIYTTISSRTYSETFIPTTYSALATLTTTLTTSTLDGHSSLVPLVIGPGGVAWTPLVQPSGTAPNLSPPTVLPTIPNLPGRTTATQGSSAAKSSVIRSPGVSNPNGVPSKTPMPETTAGTHPSGAPLITITTSYDPEASTVTSIGPEITGNTVIRTSDDHHGLGFYPFWKGGPHCFIICPPGIDNGGIILWGMDKPGIYPPPTPPPFPGIEWPTITIDNDLEPTATEEPDEEPSNSKPDESAKPTHESTRQSTAKTTTKPSSTVQSSARSSSYSSSYSKGIQKYILSIETVGIDELKERNSWMVKYYHLGGASGAITSGSAEISTTGKASGQGSATREATTKMIASNTGPHSTNGASPPRTTKAAESTASFNPDCPNNGVDENGPNCPKPSSTTGFSCGLASNVGVATFSPATWCACRNPDKSYSTMSGDHPCAYSTPPATEIHPSAVKPSTTKAPTGVPPLTDCSLVITTNAGSIAPGPQTYCSCGPVIAGINTKTSDNTVYSICAGDPFPTIASSTIDPVKTTAPAKPKPSEAIIVYREDSCNDVDCSSLGHVYEITPGQPVDPCKDDDVYSRAYTQGAANDDSDYPVNLGPFKAHNIDGLRYSGSNNHVGTLTGDVPGSPIQCIVPAAQGTSCTSSHSLDADDFIPIVYCEW